MLLKKTKKPPKKLILSKPILAFQFGCTVNKNKRIIGMSISLLILFSDAPFFFWGGGGSPLSPPFSEGPKML